MRNLETIEVSSLEDQRILFRLRKKEGKKKKRLDSDKKGPTAIRTRDLEICNLTP